MAMAAVVSIAAAADQSAAANDGGAYRCHQNNGTQCPAGNKEVSGGFYIFCEVKTNPKHPEKIGEDNNNV